MRAAPGQDARQPAGHNWVETQCFPDNSVEYGQVLQGIVAVDNGGGGICVVCAVCLLVGGGSPWRRSELGPQARVLKEGVLELSQVRFCQVLSGFFVCKNLTGTA
jgi:hypothetical protein